MLATMLCLLALQGPADIPIPGGAAIRLDGDVAEAEWADAHTIEQEFAPGRRLRLHLKRTGPWLAFGVTAQRAYQGEIIRFYVSDADDDWIVAGILGLGQPAMPPLLWRRNVPELLRQQTTLPEAARACRVRMKLDAADQWSGECLVRLSALGIGRGDLRRFVGRLVMVGGSGPNHGLLIAVPRTLTDPFNAKVYSALVSEDGWGRDEKWEPVPAEASLEFDDHRLLYALFLEREAVEIEERVVSRVIDAAVHPLVRAAVTRLEKRLLAGEGRNPSLPAWRLHRAQLLQASGRTDEARAIVESLPPSLLALAPFRRLRARLHFDALEWEEAIRLAEPVKTQQGMQELLAAAKVGLEVSQAEVAALKADAAKTEPNPRVRIHTGKGAITLELFEDDAPRAVRNFMDLVMNRKYYDGLRFHDIFGANYVAVGDPRLRGDGAPDLEDPVDGPGFQLKADPPKRPLLPGYVATALQEKGLYHGSNFAIALSPLLGEGLKVAVFGRVVEGMENVRKLEIGDRIDRIEVISKRDHDYDALACRLKK